MAQAGDSKRRESKVDVFGNSDGTGEEAVYDVGPSGAENALWLYSLTRWDTSNVERDEKQKVEMAERVAPKFKAALGKIAKAWVFQAEVSQEGQVHFQIQVNLHEKKRQGDLIRMLKGTILEGAHVSRTSTNGQRRSFSYCMKKASRIAGPWADRDTMDGDDPLGILAVREHKEGKAMFPAADEKEEEPADIKVGPLWHWQEYIRQDCKKPYANSAEMRQVNVLFDPNGCVGKTVLMKTVTYHKEAMMVPPYTRVDNIMAAVLQGHKLGFKAFVIDLPRAMDAMHDRLKQEIYMGIENLKNGVAYDWRHTNRQAIFSAPKLWVFTNSLPPMSALSADRWKIWMVDPTTKQLIKWSKAREIKLRAYGRQKARLEHEAQVAAERAAGQDHCGLDDLPDDDVEPSAEATGSKKRRHK